MPESAVRRQSTETLEKLYDGKLRLERRNGGTKIYARTFLQGKAIIKSTGELTVPAATKVATAWYLGLLDRIRKGEELHGKSFADMAEAFLLHADQVREVSEGQHQNYRDKLNLLDVALQRLFDQGDPHVRRPTVAGCQAPSVAILRPIAASRCITTASASLRR